MTSRNSRYRAQLDQSDAVEAAGNAIVAGQPPPRWLTGSGALGVVRLVGKHDGAASAITIYALEGCFLVHFPLHGVHLGVREPLTRELLAELQGVAQVDTAGGIPEGYFRSPVGLLLADLRRWKRLLVFLAASVGVAVAVWGAFRGGDGLPALREIVGLELTVAAVFLGVFALYSGLAQNLTSRAVEGHSARLDNYVGDRTVLSWILLSMSAAVAAFLGSHAVLVLPQAVAPAAVGLVQVAAALGAGAMAPPFADLLEFFVGRTMNMSSLASIRETHESESEQE